MTFKINETIIEHRQSKKEVHTYENFPMATEDEIDDFIETNPYYDGEVKNFLLSNYDTSAMFVSESWFGRFYSAITCWYDSEEWVDYSREALINALPNYEDGSITKLSMPNLDSDET